MQKVYATMAFAFAAVLFMSVWVGLNDMRVAKNLTADQADKGTIGQGRGR